MIIEITEAHIQLARHTPIYVDEPYPPEADVLYNAFADTGIDVKLESYGGLDGSSKDWKIHVDGKAYIMTAHLKLYYGDAIYQQADSRTKPATITLDDATMTASVRVKRWISYAKMAGYKYIDMGGYWE